MKLGLGIKPKARNFINYFRVAGKQKKICIGLNKTGTTSLEKEMIDLGFIVGDQWKFTKMIEYWAKRDFKPIIKLCKTAQFFQYAPFSYPFTFIIMDQAFPKSKFILTIRDNADQWYNSLIKFHGKLWGNGSIPPTIDDLKKAPGPWPGFRYYAHKIVKNVPENYLYNRTILIDFYNIHNKNVTDYFKHRANDLLVINLREKNSYARFCDFLGVEQLKEKFPWENKT